MDRKTIRILSEEVMELLNDSYSDYFDIEYGGGRYSDTKATLKLVFYDKESGGKIQDKKNNWDENCHLFGMKKNDFAKEFISGNDMFIITGLNTRARRYPIKATRKSDNKRFKFPARYVKECLAIGIHP